MAFDLLNRLLQEGTLRSCSILVADESLPKKTRRVFGRDVIRISHAAIEFQGGETGHETHSVPMDSVLEIERGSIVLYTKKKRIQRIYPR